MTMFVAADLLTTVIDPSGDCSSHLGGGLPSWSPQMQAFVRGVSAQAAAEIHRARRAAIHDKQIAIRAAKAAAGHETTLIDARMDADYLDWIIQIALPWQGVPRRLRIRVEVTDRVPTVHHVQQIAE